MKRYPRILQDIIESSNCNDEKLKLETKVIQNEHCGKQTQSFKVAKYCLKLMLSGNAVENLKLELLLVY